uniref:Putative dystrophin-like protein n=1 Tax=Ornithodoros turicata TaxID=34597 RepID=A0A2R5LCX4_9ACAR
MDDWERQETSAGIPYYVNHRQEKTQWDHPEMVQMTGKLTSYNDIKYAAYRTGAKLIFLQKELLFSNIHVSMLNGAFEPHGLEGVGQHELLLGCTQVEDLLADLFRRAPGVHQQKVPLLASLALNLLQNVFDPKRKGTMTVLQVKTALFVFCAGRLLDKLKYICGELQDGNHRISHEEMENFLRNISRIPEFLGEKLSFGSHFVPAAVESICKLTSLPTIPDDVFLNWLLKEPQNLVWISTFYRMRSTENVAHPMKCGACKTHPIIGLRYQCLQCLNYDLCQNCFLHGIVTKNHSIKHRMQEHCQQTSSWERMKSVLKTLSLKIQRWKREPRPSYLPLQASAEPKSITQKSPKDYKQEYKRKHDEPVKPTANGNHHHNALDTLHQQELESIIERLERENRNLAREVMMNQEGGSTPKAPPPSSPVRPRYLHQHLVQVDSQLKRMRSLLQHLLQNGGTADGVVVQNGATPHSGNDAPPAWLQSTPANGNCAPAIDRFLEIHKGLKALDASPSPPVSNSWDPQPAPDVAGGGGDSDFPPPPSPIVRRTNGSLRSNGSVRQTSLSDNSAKECTFGDLTRPFPSAYVQHEDSPALQKPFHSLRDHPLDGELESILRQLDDLLSEPKPGYNSAVKNNVRETVTHVQQVMDRMKQGS